MDEEEEDPDDFFDAMIYALHAENNGARDSELSWVYFVAAEYEEESDRQLGEYLESASRPAGISDEEFRTLRRKAFGFLVRDGILFKRGRKAEDPPRRVVGLRAERERIMIACHDEIGGHRGVKATFHHLSRRYQWCGMYDDVRQFVESCDECQRRARLRLEEPLHPTLTTAAFQKVGVDVVHLPSSSGYKYVVFARDDFTGWLEGRALTAANSKSVAKFLYEDVICRHGCPLKIVLDGGSENKGEVTKALAAYGVDKVSISAYHPQANGLVERGHDVIVNSLAKYSKGRRSEWFRYLPLAIWADRITVRRSTGYSAFRLLYGRDCLLPIEFELSSWATVDWDNVRTPEELLQARMRQLDQQALEEARAAEQQRRSRFAGKEYFDAQRRIRTTPLEIGDMVLLHNSAIEKSHDVKLDNRWLGPYRVRKARKNGSYLLAELDGTELLESVAGNRLKRFFVRRPAGVEGG